MDFMKKRKLEDNGVVSDPSFLPRLSLEDARKILESFTRDQLFEIVQNAVVRHPDVLGAVRSIADQDTTQRKLFIRGLGWETTTDKLRSLFSTYGELEEAVVILDKATGKSKGYGFITFKHIDGALLALKEPSKQIDGRMTVTQLAAAGMQGGPGGGSSNNPVDISLRKIYVGNVPYDMPTERLLQQFSMYGEIEEGPLGFDKVTGKSKGYALFVYKTAEAARASIMEPVKNIDGKQLNCKLAIDGKKGKSGPSGPGGAQGPREGFGNDIGLGMQNGIGAQYGGPGGIHSGAGAFSGAMATLGGVSGSGVNLNGPGLPSIGNQAGVSPMVGGGSGPYNRSHFSIGGSTGYAGFSASTGGLGGVTNGYGAPGAGSGLPSVGGGLGAATGRGPSSYALPQSSAGMPSGDYHSQGMHYNMPSSGNQNRQNQQAGASPVPRVMHGGMYQGMPSYY
ncbi:PREDICTED: UBP1-associated protein 2C-like [Ipomoea nil]|uniref:UBP1-associated protein 2C-like n=1 Tax=Ipomoea nil TaxID=35883 RepID=UPI0009015761|nr:PREDICTED: UBP1-associated protein 2C-like [Ipomoea nil]XP_019153989.1 PREDICTED: UBP1-associated protein 2C-like [Ipomoea nil]